VGSTLDRTLACLVALSLIGAVVLTAIDKDATQAWIVVGLFVGLIGGKNIEKGA
jgi:hypothetical protein